MPLTLVADTGAVRLYHGDAAEYDRDDIDLVLTNPYARLPRQFRVIPQIISGFIGDRQAIEDTAGASLVEVARWHTDGSQGVWVANVEPKALDLSFISAEQFAPDRGWWPLDLPVRLLEAFAWCDGLRVWDGFCGRGTTGKACQLLGHKFVGIDISAERVELARRYLGC